MNEATYTITELAREFGVKQPDRILEQTGAAIADWERFAAEYEVPQHVVKAIRKELDADWIRKKDSS